MFESGKIEVSRQIPAAAPTIFEILRDPQMHQYFDGSGMITGSTTESKIEQIGDRFTMKMHRADEDYLMINIVVGYDPDQRILWTPAPGDTSRSEGHKEENIGRPAGYIWGYILEPLDPSTTKVTEVFEFGPLSAKHFEDGGKWINTKNSVEESMQRSLELLDALASK